MVGGRGGDRGGGGPEFGAEGERIGLERHQRPPGADDLELVAAALADVGEKDLPDAGVLAQPHRMAAAVPIVEIADHRDAAGVRGPDREMDTEGALMRDEVGAKLVEQPEMRPLGDIVVVHRAEHRTERIGIGQVPVAAGVAGVIAYRLTLLEGEHALEEAGIIDAPSSPAASPSRVKAET